MSIRFSCRCGKSLKVPDTYAGRKVKCPGCGKSLVAPEPAPAPAPAPAETVQFGCACGQQMQASSEFAGQAAQCPSCGQAVLIPGRPGQAQAARAPAPAAEAPAGAGFPGLDDEATPARRSRRGDLGGFASWLLLLSSTFLLGLTGLGAYFHFLAPVPEDLALVPADAVAFATVRPADLWGHPRIREETPPPLREMLETSKDLAGFGLSEVERITLVADRVEPSPVVWVVVAVKEPCDPQKVKAALNRDGREKTHQGKSYFLAATGAIYFASDRVFVLSSEEGVRACIDRGPRGRDEGPLGRALRRAAGRTPLIAAAAPPEELLGGLAGQAPALPGPSGEAIPMGWVKQVRLLGLKGSADALLDLELTVALTGADSAREACGALEQLRDLAAAATALRPESPGREYALGVLDRLRVTQSGADVIVTTRLEISSALLEEGMRDLPFGR